MENKLRETHDHPINVTCDAQCPGYTTDKSFMTFKDWEENK